jgi:hypothetical protein
MLEKVPRNTAAAVQSAAILLSHAVWLAAFIMAENQTRLRSSSTTGSKSESSFGSIMLARLVGTPWWGEAASRHIPIIAMYGDLEKCGLAARRGRQDVRTSFGAASPMR